MCRNNWKFGLNRQKRVCFQIIIFKWTKRSLQNLYCLHFQKRINKLQDLLLDSKIDLVEFEKMNQRNGLKNEEIISELGRLKSSNSEIKSKINQGIKIQNKIAESYAIATTVEK
jgi:hypothetical protein